MNSYHDCSTVKTAENTAKYNILLHCIALKYIVVDCKIQQSRNKVFVKFENIAYVSIYKTCLFVHFGPPKRIRFFLVQNIWMRAIFWHLAVNALGEMKWNGIGLHFDWWCCQTKPKYLFFAFFFLLLLTNSVIYVSAFATILRLKL